MMDADEKENNDGETICEDQDVINLSLNLSQLESKNKRPRVHWAQSPLAQSHVVTDDTPDHLDRPLTSYNFAPSTADDPSNSVRKALTGLLRSKSSNSSPLDHSKLKRPYITPVKSVTQNFQLINLPSSSSVLEDEEGDEIGDIEDIAAGIGSSFFSDPPQQQQQLEISKKDLEGLDDFDFFDPIITESLPPQLPTLKPRLFHRGLISAIDRISTDSIRLLSDNQQLIIVKGDWIRTALAAKLPFYVHVIFEDDIQIVDDQSGYLVIHPDTLITSTLVSDSVSCARRAIISSRTQASVEDNKPSASLICGSIVHEIIEKALIQKKYNASFLHSLIPDQVKRALPDIFCAGLEESAIIEQVKALLEPFPSWAENHLEESGFSLTGETLECCQVEENIWSHAFGLKGKIDATVMLKDLFSGRAVLAPFELKTGHGTSSIAHRAQVLLYGFMLWDRYGVRPDCSLLFYISKGELFKLTPSRTDLRSLLNARNNLAIQMQASSLPAPITNKHLCSKCFQLESCTLYHRIVEQNPIETAPSPSHALARTGHLTNTIEKNLEFYQKWERLVYLEEQEALKSRQSLWTSTIGERIKQGICLGDLVFVKCVETIEAASFTGFECTFEFVGSKKETISQCHLTSGDPIVVSSIEKEQFGIAIGFLSSINNSHITVVVDRPMSLDTSTSSMSCRYRIDKDELLGSFGLLRTNLLKISAPEHQKLMELLIKLVPPKFNTETQSILPELLADFAKLDKCQQEAVHQILRTQDYLLVLGMPGTGKSTTLVFAIRLLIAMGKTILLSSHTHSAIDNILLRLKRSSSVRFVRLGNPDKIPQELHASCFDTQQFQSLPHLESFYMNAPLVACTSLGSNASVLNRRRFDYCIIDEASQISVPASLGPLRLASAFVLVGDHYQLPPLVKSKQAVEEGLNQSLFSLLAQAFPSAITMLRLQYRMNFDIMTISNKLVYNGMLVCGNEQIAQARLELPKFDALGCKYCGQVGCWLRHLVQPRTAVAFLDTDNLEAYESASGVSFMNRAESDLVNKIVTGFLQAGLDASDISVITPFRPQLKLLQNCPDEVSLSTVDRFQGLDSECIIISLVRSNRERNIGQLLRDWNRLNVAFTRAKKKLVLVGSSGTVLQHPSFKALHELLLERQWIFRLPPDALLHDLR